MNIDDLAQQIGRLQGDVQSMSLRLAQLEGDVRALKAVANIGKGAFWVALKLGGGLTLIAAAAFGVRDWIKHLFS